MSPDFRAALRLVWLGITVATLVGLAAPFALRNPAIASAIPPCESKRLYGRECFLCGATTSFIAMGHGNWREAARSNRWAIPIYLGFALNSAAFMVVLYRKSHPG